MKIAVTYDKENHSIWQHFGRTEAFKVYDVENGSITQSKVVSTNGNGHGALPGFIKSLGADVVICGGLGAPLVDMIHSLGMELYPGVTGDADGAVEKFLSGELQTNMEAVHAGCHHGEKQEHSHEEGHSCGCHHGHDEHDHDHTGEHSCGCHTPVGNEGKTCRVHYEGTFNNGEKFDSSYDRGETLEFVCGAGMMIKGFDEAVKEMKIGEIKNVHLMPEEAYGLPDPAAIFNVDISDLPGSENLEEGQQVYLTNQFGQPIPVTVAAKDETTITFDANHEMAGKELNFKIELVEVL